MIASLMIYGLAIATLLGFAAFAIERGFARLGWPRRTAWAVALVSSLALPAGTISLHHARRGVQLQVDAPASPNFVVVTKSGGLQALSSAIAPTLWPARPNLDRFLEVGWLASSLVTLVVYIAGWIGLRRAARSWRRQHIDGSTVSIADRLGPAIVGFIKPEITLPRWLLDAPSSTRTMVLAHERAHISARDPLLVLAAMLLVSLAPWNLPLLWQLRRLRFAIEVDCDARVLKGGVTPSAYGEMLLAVGQRNMRTPMVAIALTEPMSQLERRIQVFMSGAYRHAKLVAVACISASVLPVIACAQLNAPVVSPARQGVSMIDTDMKHYKSSDWGFELDIPKGWNPFPPVSANSPNELMRFESHEAGSHLLIIFRNTYDPNGDPDSVVSKTQEVLAKGGFSNFVKSETTIGSRVVKTLDFDKEINGHLWSCRHYFFIDGTLVHVLGFGTTNRDAMFPLYERMAKSFSFSG